MKYYLFVFVTIFGFAFCQESIFNLDSSVDEPTKEQIATTIWINEYDYVQEVSDSCDMRGRACQTFFYWKGYAFWLLEGNITEGSLIKLSKAINVSNSDLLRFIFIDEDSNLIKAHFVFYHDDIIFAESNINLLDQRDNK